VKWTRKGHLLINPEYSRKERRLIQFNVLYVEQYKQTVNKLQNWVNWHWWAHGYTTGIKEPTTSISYAVHTYPYTTFLTLQCSVSPFWPGSVMIILSQPVLVTWQAWSLPILTFLLFCEIIQKWTKETHFFLFIFCRAASLFAVTTLPVLASTTWLVTLVVENMTDDKSSKRFLEAGFSATCHVTPVTSWNRPLVGRHFSDIFPVTHGLNKEMLCCHCFSTCVTICHYEGCSKPGGVENRLLVCAEHAKLCGESMHSIKRKARSFISVLKVTCSEQMMRILSICLCLVRRIQNKIKKWKYGKFQMFGNKQNK